MNFGNVRKLATVLEISQTLSSALDLRTALMRVLEILEEQRGTVSGSTTLLDEESGELNIEAATGMTWQVRRRSSYRLGEGITGRVVESGRPVIVPRVSQEPLFLDRTAVWKQSGREELSFVCVPVQVGAKAAGSLGVALPYDRDRDFAREAEFLGVVATMIGQAVRVHTLVETEGPRLLMENDQLRQELRERYEFRNIIGNSRQMRDVYQEIAQVAGSPTTVMIRGESGTGKEMVAHAIHYNSPRAEGPFVKVNCGALPDTLIESELFGYEPGAFTDAHEQDEGSLRARRWRDAVPGLGRYYKNIVNRRRAERPDLIVESVVPQPDTASCPRRITPLRVSYDACQRVWAENPRFNRSTI